MLTRIRTAAEYKLVMKSIEALLQTATKKGGLHKLSKDASAALAKLSKLAETYEDKDLQKNASKAKDHTGSRRI